MIVGYARASTANQAQDKEAPAQQLTDPFGAPQSTEHGHFDRVPTQASA
jgi:DNA invertase Pin-like site-specific DNA recombinase